MYIIAATLLTVETKAPVSASQKFKFQPCSGSLKACCTTFIFLLEVNSVEASGNVSIILVSNISSLFILTKNLPKNSGLVFFCLSKTSILKSIAVLSLVSKKYDVNLFSWSSYVPKDVWSLGLKDSLNVTSYISKSPSVLPVAPPFLNWYLWVIPTGEPAWV